MELNFKLRYIFVVLILFFVAVGSLYLIFYRQTNEVPEKADLVFNCFILEEINE